MKAFKYFVEDAPTNATGATVAGTGDDSSTVVIKKKAKIYRRKKRKIDMEAKQVDEARRKDEAKKITEARFMELPNGNKIDITKLSLSQLNKLKGKKGLFKVDGNKLIPRENTKAWRKKAADEFGKYMGSKEEVEEDRNYRKEYDNYHSQPEQRERNAARLRARRQMEKWGKVKKFDKKDVHHKDNNPLNNEKDNLAVTTQSWNRSEPRLRKEESINIEERELTSNELKRREEIAKELSDADFKKRYGKDWKSIKIATATNMAKKEETIMGKKYLETKPGSLEESVDRMYDVWRQPQDSIVDEGFSSSHIKKAVKIATEMGGNMTGAVKKIEKIKKGLSNDSAVMDALKMANEQAEEKIKVDGRTKAYKEALRRIKMRQERNKHLKKENIEEAESGDKEAYEKYVKKMLKKFGVNSPADLKGDDKKKFFAALDKGWESDAEKSGKSEDWKKKKNKNVEDEDENPVGKSYNEAVVGKDALDAIYDIVNKKQHGKVLGVKVDLFTASAMQKVYQSLNDKNKAKVEKMLKDKRGVMTFAQFAMSQVK